MRASLEVRTPFLSRRLYEVIATMDPRAFMAFGQKSVQKRILARYLPERLFDERKLGFNYPDEVYLAEAPKPKAIPGVSLSQLNEAWSHRSQRYWSTLAVRMSVLGHFTNKDLTRPVAGSRSGQD
jgi:asparagine synthetase B (glutamine-hydrolysing)